MRSVFALRFHPGDRLKREVEPLTRWMAEQMVRLPPEHVEGERVKSTDFLNNANDSGVNIRVINVRRTTKRTGTTPQSGSRSSSTATAHVRRGHWRRQRYGTGMEQVKRIRIAPVLVNAHRKDITLSVYRLPAAKKMVSVN